LQAARENVSRHQTSPIEDDTYIQDADKHLPSKVPADAGVSERTPDDIRMKELTGFDSSPTHGINDSHSGDLLVSEPAD
jgi:hypothetical protein